MHLINGPVTPGVISEIIAKGGENHRMRGSFAFPRTGEKRPDRTGNLSKQ